MLDFRLPENRREGFIRYYVHQLRTTDCDPTIQMINYLFERQEYNIEQKFWMCWLYANTYQVPTAYLLFNEFPDYENVDQERLDKWNTANYLRLIYQTDCKYNKGHLGIMFKSYREVVGSSQVLFFKKLCNSLDHKENYENIRKVVMSKFHKFGRYTTWFYGQALKDCVGLPIDPTSLLFGEEGSDSHTDGMCYVANRPDQLTRYYDAEGKKHKSYRVMPPAVKRELQELADDIIAEIKTRFPDVHPDYYTMETCLCSYKKLFRRSQGRYLGYYLDRQAEDIKKTQDQGWSGVDWQILWDYRAEYIQSYFVRELNLNFDSKKGWVNTNKMHEFLDTGTLLELNQYADLENI